MIVVRYIKLSLLFGMTLIQINQPSTVHSWPRRLLPIHDVTFDRSFPASSHDHHQVIGRSSYTPRLEKQSNSKYVNLIIKRLLSKRQVKFAVHLLPKNTDYG